MLKSLWSGVSGLQAHQTAIDVEGNNIANVNTVGYKYSRASFSDMLSLTKDIATAPQGSLGGQNDLSVGLGTQTSATTRIYLQGSLESTDKTTDVALEGDGFFVLSGDGGVSQSYTRSGDFTFDANGNLVDNNGYIVQGWVKEITTSEDACESDDLMTTVDSTGPVGNIQIDPGLVLPSKKSSEITLRANLNSGDTVEQMECIRQLDSTSTTISDVNSSDFSYQYDSTGELVEVSEDFGVLFNDSGEAMNLSDGQGVWMSFQTAKTDSSAVTNVGTASLDISFNLNGVDIDNGSGGAITINEGTAEQNANAIAALINGYTDQTGVEAVVKSGTGIQLVNVNDDSSAKKNIIIDDHSSGVSNFITDSVSGDALDADESIATAFRFEYNSTSSDSAGATWSNYGGANNNGFKFNTTEDLRRMMQTLANKVKSTDVDRVADVQAQSVSDSATTVSVTVSNSGRFVLANRYDSSVNSSNSASGATNVTGDDTLNINVTDYSYTDNDSATTDVQSNKLFSETFSAMNISLSARAENKQEPLTTQSNAINAAQHGASIDVYDSLGSRHTLQIEWRKTDDKEWTWRAIVPEPGELVGASSSMPNILEGGTVTFNNDGSLKGFNPPTLQYDPKNGASAPQLVRLSMGDSGTFNGLTSVDSKSTTTAISQNGYAAGDLLGLTVDSTGTVLGSFSNGRSVGLAKLAVATFANNSGLHSDGGNLFSASANSGEAVVGTAGDGGRGDIASSMLEMSNVDLSRSLTQLIVIQRGYQANSKTITTSDQLLQALLQIKQ